MADMNFQTIGMEKMIYLPWWATLVILVGVVLLILFIVRLNR